MAEIRLLPDHIDPVQPGHDHNGWYACAEIFGDIEVDASAPTETLALASLAQKLAERIEALGPENTTYPPAL